MTLLAVISTIFMSSAEAAGKQDYCKQGGDTVALLIDRTTAYDEQDFNVLVQGLEAMFDKLNIGDRLVVHTIQEDYTQSEKVFESCVPGCKEGGGLGDWVAGTCRAMQAKQDNRKFRIDLAVKLKGMLQDIRTYPQSDILRTVQEVARAYANKDLKRMVMFTDLLENSDVLSYQGLASMDPSKAGPFLRDNDLVPKLSGVNVDVFGFGRGHDDKRKALAKPVEKNVRTFWKTFFQEGGASNVTIGLWYGGAS